MASIIINFFFYWCLDFCRHHTSLLRLFLLLRVIKYFISLQRGRLITVFTHFLVDTLRGGARKLAWTGALSLWGLGTLSKGTVFLNHNWDSNQEPLRLPAQPPSDWAPACGTGFHHGLAYYRTRFIPGSSHLVQVSNLAARLRLQPHLQVDPGDTRLFPHYFPWLNNQVQLELTVCGQTQRTRGSCVGEAIRGGFMVSFEEKWDGKK